MNKGLILCAVLLIASFAACSRGGELRGSAQRSSDGKTYLVVADDNGGACALKLDGNVWPHPKGERGIVEPGRHKLSACGDDGGITFDVAAGTTYTFDYWGP